MKFNSSWSLRGQTKRFLNRFIYAFILTASGALLTACVSSSGGGGGGGAAAPSAPSRVGVFSHAAYDFVLLNATQAGRNQSPVGERRLGLIQVEEAEIRARLPEGAVWQPDDVRYTIVGGANDLTRAFFRLEPGHRAALLFEAAPRYASRTFSLDYVVNTLGVDALRVMANVSYVDAQGARQTLGLYEVPVTMRAVAEVPAANDFVVFDGLRESGSEARRTTTTNTRAQRFDAGMLRETINITAEGSVFGMFTARWTDEHYVADAAEQRLYDGPRAGAPAAFDLSQLVTSAAPRQTRQALAVTVTLTLNNNSATQVSDDYVIAAETNLTTINGASTEPDSFLAFLQDLNATDNNPPFDFVALDANDRLGSNVTAIAWSFTFPYTADVTTTTTTTRSVRVSRLAYTAEGAIDENVAGRTSLSRSAEVLRTLGIRLNRPAGFEGSLPTLYFQVANANVSEAHCETAFYLDQGYRDYQNYQIKAQASPDAARPLLNHEARAAYACKMEVSLRGTDSSYRAITTGNLTDTTNQTTAVAGTAVDLNVVTCGSANATTRLQALRTAPGCIYRADVGIAVRDLNEPVEFNFEAVVTPALDEANVGAAGDTMAEVGTPLNTSASDPVLATFTYREPDQNATGGRLDVDVPQIRRVVPAQVQPTGAAGSVATAPLFYIEPRPAERAALMLNTSVAASVLDYEALVTNATGQRGLRITLQATDNSTARLVTERVFNLEVQDVVYKPIDLAYTPQVDSFNRSLVSDPVVQLLLPGFAQFVANGGPVLGRMQAVDPETNTSAGLSYAYVGVAPLPADRANPAVLAQVPLWNASFTLGQNPQRPTADELLLVGVGLRAGADFHVQLQARNESPRMNVTGDVVPVRTRARYDAVNTSTTYGGEPPIKFNTGTFLGFVAEGEVGVEVYNSTGQPRTNLGHLLVAPADDNRAFFIMTPAEIAPLVSGLGPLALDVQRALASRLAVLSGPEQFNLNQSTGALSLQTDTAADFTTQPVHMLLVRVANRSDVGPAAYRVSDYALVQVVVEDTNTAPALMNLRAVHETVSTTSSLVRLTDLPEDTPAGTVLATLEVRDDNPLTGVNFAPAAGATAYTIERTAASQRVAATATEAAHYVASYRLVTVAPDYEANATLDVVHRLVDNGRYGYDPLRQMVVRAAPSLVNTTMLRVNASVVDVNEAPVLRFMQSRVDLPEKAAQDDAVVTVRAEDPEGLVANLTYTLTTVPGTLAAAFNVTEVGATVTNEGRVATWALKVADTNALENAGDGQIFTLTLMATDLRGASTSAPLVITVLDEPSVLNVARVNTTDVMLSEQQALDDPDRVLRAPLFRFVDVQSDYDEYFFGLSPRETDNPVRFGDVAFAPGAISYVDAQGMPATTITDGLHNEERFNLFTLQEENAAVNLVLGEAGLIEPHLLGRNVRVEVRLSDPAGVGASAVATVPVAIVPTQPEGLRFADASAAPLMPPAVYNFEYDQTAYAEPLGDGACTPDNATQLTYDGRCYPTEQVRVDANSAPVLYVRRDPNPSMLEAPTTVTSVNNTFGILLHEGANLTDSDIQVYTLDAAGNLAASGAMDDFETYFQYRLDTSYAVGGANRTALLLEQKMHAVLYANGSGVNPDAHYAALDTLPLDSREGNQERVLSFFFVAGEGATNASRRAIAQLNVEVKSAGLNVRASVTELRLGGISFPVGPGADKRISFAENGAGAVGFPTHVINDPAAVLQVAIENPDSAERNQTVNATIDVVMTDTDTNDPATAGTLNVPAGTASGNELVRLGNNVDDAQQRLAIGLGVRNATDDLLFQLARNVYGRAYIRVRFEERDDQERLVEDPYYEYFLIDVTSVAEVASRITDIRVAGESSPVDEDGFGTASPQLNITLTNEQFRSPRNLDLINVDVDATNSPHAGLVVAPGEMAEVVVPVGRLNVQHVLQDLNYTMHAHGTTTFTVKARARERRGFADELHPYDERTLSSPPFAVTSVNDPLMASPRPVASAGFSLQRQFLSGGQRVTDFVRGTSEVTVFFTDVDLVTGDALPVNPVITFPAQRLGNSSTMINPTDFRVPTSSTTIMRDGVTADVRVRFPVEIQLSQAQYDAISPQETGFELNLTVALEDGDDDTVTANINAPLISFAVATDDAVLAPVGDYDGGVVPMDEGTPDETVLPIAVINITDADIRRASGDTFTYGLLVTRERDGAAVADLLEWREVDDPATNRRQLRSQTSALFFSSLRLAKTPQDADVGSYEVNWTITEQRPAEGTMRQFGSGSLTLNIVNVEDEVTVVSDQDTVPSAGYQGAAFNLQNVFGLQGRDNMLLGSAQDTGQNITVIFRDDDLLVPPGRNSLPRANVSFVNVQLTPDGEAPISLSASQIDTTSVSDPVHLGDGRINVTVPLNLTLTQTQYDAINAEDNGGVLSFDVRLASGPNVANAQVEVTINVADNLAIVEGQPTDQTFPEGTTSGTVVTSELQIRDADARRGMGNGYTYSVVVTDNANDPVTDLLTGSLTNIQNGLSAVFNQSITFTKVLDDAEVAASPYTVTWTLTDHRNPSGTSTQVATGSFELTLTNVNDGLRSVCGRTQALQNCGYESATYLISELVPVPGQTSPVRNVTVVFEDNDLLAGVPLDLTLSNLVESDAVIDLTFANDFVRADVAAAVRAAPNANQFELTVPVRLTLTQTEFNAVNSSGMSRTVNFDFSLRDSGDVAMGRAIGEASIVLLPDGDADGVRDDQDNCPRVANPDQEDDDGDMVGNTCEAEMVENLMATADGINVMNLTWMNPSGSNITLLNISVYDVTNSQQGLQQDLPNDAIQAQAYRVTGLTAGTNYRFILSGTDGRHGRITQTLPSATVMGTTLEIDTDGDGTSDRTDNCPLVRNVNQADNNGNNDGDMIGDACEAVMVADLAAVADGPNAMNLTWTNPSGSNITLLNISVVDVGTNSEQSRQNLPSDLTQAGASVTHRVTGLIASTNYRFTISGIDSQHGRLNQTLPPAEVPGMTPAGDTDGDGVNDDEDNCPSVPNPAPQLDTDGDLIGDACEAEAVLNLAAVEILGTMHHVNLSWTNPGGSELTAMNLSYRIVGRLEVPTEMDITASVDLSPGVATHYVVTGLTNGTNYNFTVSGVDRRDGRNNQALPPASINLTTFTGVDDTDGDGIRDADDNCPLVRNTGQDDMDVDGIGDACEAIGVTDLVANMLNTTTVELTWTNPVNSTLLLLQLNVTSAEDTRMNTGGTIITIDDANLLGAGSDITWRLDDLDPGTMYTITVNGTDFRQGRVNQSLPDVVVTFTLPADADRDGVPDGADNCLSTSNPMQTDANDDGYGDACGPDADSDGLRDIQTAAQLDAIRDNASVDYELLLDIDLGAYADNWTPINNFSGTLNGNGHSIYNFSITSAMAENVGLFGEVASGAEIHNLVLRVQNIVIKSDGLNLGGLVGNANLSTPLIIRDTAVIITNSLSAGEGVGIFRVGGLVGVGNVDIARSYVMILGDGNISSDAPVENEEGNGYVGGLVGEISRTNGNISDSYVLALNGHISTTNRNMTDAFAGGLVGYISSGMNLTSNNTYVVVDEVIATSAMGQTAEGGLIGQVDRAQDLTLTSSYYNTAGPSPEDASYRLDMTSQDDGSDRTLEQLQCPTVSNATCSGATTYTGWDGTIWNFGLNSDLPDLRSNARPADLN